MVENQLTHLCVHSQYSLLQATASVDALVQLAVQNDLTALALTDRNTLSGAVVFSQACQKVGVQPIIGLTLSVQPPFSSLNQLGNKPGLLVLLAQNRAGYQSLCHLSSWLQGSSDREERLKRGLPWAILKEHTAGLFAIDGGRLGWLHRCVAAGEAGLARDYASRFGGLYAENGFIGHERTAMKRSTAPTSDLLAIGAQFGLRPTTIQPVYCASKKDRPLLKLLAAIERNCHVNEVADADLPHGGEADIDVAWRHPQEIARRFDDLPEAVATVGEIAARCEPALPDGSPIWPILDLPSNQSAETALVTAAENGLVAIYGDGAAPAIHARLEHELGVINRYGFAPLFLIVADIVRFARENEVPVSTRGSVADCLVAYCIGITTVDPIAYDLLFERFLNPARVGIPDIDLDFCSRRRDLVLEYVRKKYGEDKVALVGTINTFRPKSAVRETAKAHGYSSAEIKRLGKFIPSGWHPDPARRDRRTLAEMASSVENRRDRNIFLLADRIVGQPNHMSVHPGGTVITPSILMNTVPVQMAPKGFLITQFDYRDVETIGLPKLDLLGIRALTVIADSAELVRQNHDPTFRIDNILDDDPATAATIEKGDLIGVFQFDSIGSQHTLRKLKARNIQDMAVSNAFFKPGPATGGMANAFVRRYRGEERVSYLHPSLESILSPTKGVLLFQEQILRVVREIAGLSWSQADQVRKGISKFAGKELAQLKNSFVAGCQRPAIGMTPSQAETLWTQVEAFAGYGFNQGHATAYGVVSYQSAYLRARFSAEFFAARLANGGGYHHPAMYIAEARKLGIEVRQPHVNHSKRKFTLAYENKQPVIWMGLGWVRDLRRRSVATIEAEQPFDNLRDLLNRVPLQQKEIRHLIQCGALAGWGSSRSALLAEHKQLERAGSVQQMAFTFGQVDGAESDATPAESAQQRYDWEMRILDMPVTVHALEFEQRHPRAVAFDQLPTVVNKPVVISGTRIPTWADRGIYLSDQNGYLYCKISRDVADRVSKPKGWQTVHLLGRYRIDKWGGFFFDISNTT